MKERTGNTCGPAYGTISHTKLSSERKLRIFEGI